MANQTPKRPRAGKTIRGQYILYIEHLKSNKAFRENKFDANQPHIIEETWEKLVQLLNASGGPIRNVKEWKGVFTDWRSHQTKGQKIEKCSKANWKQRCVRIFPN